MTLKFPLIYTPIIESFIKELGFKLSDCQRLAKAILELSDLYTSSHEIPNIWQSKNYCSAYLVYFFPLNYLRNLRTIKQLQEMNFWDLNIQNWWELGSGTGAAFLAYLDFIENPRIKSAFFLDKSPEAHRIFKYLLEKTHPEKTHPEKTHPEKAHQDKKHPESSIYCQWETQQTHHKIPSNSLFVASYALNELSSSDSLINLILKFEHHFIVESSQQDVTRKLMLLRDQAIKNQLNVWGPCTHHQDCPLLKHSKKDWCFDRFFIEMPDWYYEIEKYLPMKNRSLTHSYLGLSRSSQTSIKTESISSNSLSNLDSRVIGDTLREKGKTRQAICRNSEREFLAWLKKSGPPTEIPRGSVISSKDFVKVGNELRPSKDSKKP